MKPAIKIFLVVTCLIIAIFFIAKINAPKTTDPLNTKKDESKIYLEFQDSVAQKHIVNRVFISTVRPSTQVNLSSQINSVVKKIHITEGQTVKKNDLLVTLDMQNRLSAFKAAQSNLTQQRAEYYRIKKLSSKGYKSKANLSSALSQVESAKAELDRSNLEILNTKIKAPYDAIVESLEIEIGDLVTNGSNIAKLIKKAPAELEFFVNDDDLNIISLGKQIFTDKNIVANISYISTLADEQTKTYKILAVPQATKNKFNLGSSVKVTVPFEVDNLHYVPTSSLSLISNGDIGIKYQDENKKVIYQKVRIIDEDKNGYYVSGLPNKVKVITKGHEFAN